jgi:hypothetical protein
MGLLPVESLPNQFDVVWCLWPRKEDKMQPGPVARPVLVLDVLQSADGKIGSVIVAYGTGTDEPNSPFLDGGPDLVIDTKAAAQGLGLHKRTQFSMSPLRRKQLTWSDEYFVPQPYRRGSCIIAGSLTDEQVARVKECFKSRGLDPYWSAPK